MFQNKLGFRTREGIDYMTTMQKHVMCARLYVIEISMQDSSQINFSCKIKARLGS